MVTVAALSLLLGLQQRSLWMLLIGGQSKRSPGRADDSTHGPGDEGHTVPGDTGYEAEGHPVSPKASYGARGHPVSAHASYGARCHPVSAYASYGSRGHPVSSNAIHWFIETIFVRNKRKARETKEGGYPNSMIPLARNTSMALSTSRRWHARSSLHRAAFHFFLDVFVSGCAETPEPPRSSKDGPTPSYGTDKRTHRILVVALPDLVYLKRQRIGALHGTPRLRTQTLYSLVVTWATKTSFSSPGTKNMPMTAGVTNAPSPPCDRLSYAHKFGVRQLLFSGTAHDFVACVCVPGKE
ncbi:uncharacterized protein LOC144168040 [Haemaphysalis longicornis]